MMVFIGDLDILLVEDNMNDAELTQRALKRNNLANRIVHVWDGEEALEFIFGKSTSPSDEIAHSPRLIILDLKLPKVDGLEVLAALKKDPRTALIPIVVLTSSKEEKDVIESYRLGVNSYIVKPVDFDKFLQAVRELGMYWLLLNQPPAVK